MKTTNLANFPFWIICISFCIGVAIASHFNPTILEILIVIATFLLALIFLHKKIRSIYFIILSSALFICLGIARYQILLPKYQANHITNQNTEELQELVFLIKKVFKPSANFYNYKAKIHSINSKKTIGNMLLSVKKSDSISPFSKGDSFVTLGNLKVLKLTKIPYGFEYANYLKTHYISHQLWTENQKLFKIETLSNPVFATSNKFRKRLETNLKKQQLTPNVRQLTEALVLGNKSGINKQLNEDFSNAGVIHVLAISGLHIGIIYFILMWVFKRIFPHYSKRIIRSALILICLWVFTWFSGGSPSAVRSTTMFTCFEIARLLMRRQHAINPLFITIFILLIFDPLILFSVGFQLSVVAVASIIIGVPKLLVLWYPANWFVRKLWEIISVSTCAQLGLLPLSIYYFHKIPGLFLVANIPLMIVITVVLIAAIIIVLGSYFIQLPDWIIIPYNWSITVVDRYIHWVASFEAYIFKSLYINNYTLAFCYLFIAFLIYCYHYKKAFTKWVVPIFSLGIIVVFWEFAQRIYKKELWLLHNYKQTIITEITSKKLHVYSHNPLSISDDIFLISPMRGSLHYKNSKTTTLKNAYRYKDKSILILNSESAFIPEKKMDIIILTDSPKINLERVLISNSPKLIIAMPHNYKNVVKKWKTTCTTYKVAFYDVSEKGSINLANL